MPIAPYFISRYKLILSREPEMITQTRIRILANSFFGLIGLCLTLLALYLLQEHNFLLIRISILLVAFITGFLFLLYKASWRFAGHFFIICILLMVWTNVLLFRQGVNIVTIQFTMLVISAGYYILGAKWGAIYSFISILPIISFVIIDNYINATLSSQHLHINNHAFVITLVFNFMLLIYIHFSFFKAYQISNLKELELREHLQKAAIAAQEIATAKTNFLSTMSHELRTPLNAVVGMTNILLMEDPRPEQLENLDILRFSAENLMCTVNDILDFNKIDCGEVVLEKHVFRPDELMNSIYGAFKTQAKDKYITLDCRVDPDLIGLQVTGDEMRLTQILLNLVGNAVKFTSNGSVVLEGKIVYRDTEKVNVLFSVEDTGIGIPDDRISIIFDPFTQVLPRTNRQYHGTGLGLTIAYRLVKLHNSELNLHSVEGRGTTFSFELQYPICTAESLLATKTANNNKVSNDLSSLRILIAEDEPINVLVLEKILRKWGIVPDVVIDGLKAVEAVMKNDYDVILMDINMPVMDGFEAAKQIKEMEGSHNSGIPIVAITASIGAALDKINDYQYIDHFILKPFKLEHLRDQLEIALNKKGK